jgi:hypothetical protein
MAQLLRLVGDSWRHGQDKSEIILAPASASRYFSIQFFASLEKWIGARNPVRIGSSCAAVTGYNFPLGQSSKPFEGEGGKKVFRQSVGTYPGARIFVRSTSFGPVATALCAVPDASHSDAATTEKTSSQKEE